MTPRSRHAALVVIALGLIALAPLSERRADSSATALSEFPSVANCSSVAYTTNWRPEFVGADETLTREYSCGSGIVSASSAIWKIQRPGKEAVNEGNQIIPDDWRFITKSARVATPSNFDATEFVVGLDSEPFVIWTWYAIGDRPAAGEFEAKAREAINAALFRRAPTAMFVVGARATTVEGARELLRQHAPAVWHAYLTSQSFT
jgi:EpsI family protein